MNEDVITIRNMLQTINNVKNGLNPEVLEEWYSIIEKDAKSKCPENVKDSIKVIRNPALPLKFEFKSSKRALPWIISSIENHLEKMPFATRLYFQKLEEIIRDEAEQFYKKQSVDADFR